MGIINSSLLSKRQGIFMSLLIFSSLFLSENAFSKWDDQMGKWSCDYMQVAYSKLENAIVMRFEFFDYNFGLFNENGYIEWCDFSYSTADGDFYKFMKAETNDQGLDYYSWVDMKDKLPGTLLQFNECVVPASGALWHGENSTQRVNVHNYFNKAYLSVKWYLGSEYKNIKSIRINGKWHVNGIWPNQFFDETYNLPDRAVLKSEQLSDYHLSSNNEAAATGSKNIAVKVYKNADEIVIKGAGPSENIKIYTASGALIKTIVTSDEVVKIKLPVNQTYIINIGQRCHKVAL